ncbi:Dihydrolipoamide acetyltransferase component of pyruvate dehydrogenase complex, partial [Dysosmobacter welbionis]
QGLGRPAPTQFFCDRWQLHLPVCLLFFVKPACEVQGGHVLERQFHRHSGGRGLIHGKDHLQRPAAGLSVDIRGPVMDDGVHHIRVNGGMAVAVDIAGGLLKPLQGCVLLPLVGKLPDVDVIGGGTADLHRSRLTEEIQRLFQVFGVDVGGALDGADGAVGEFHHRHAHVLTFQIVMELLSRLGIDLHHIIPHHPAQKIHAMDALVHHAASVLGPSAAPGGLVVIALVPVPAHMDGAVGELAEPALLQGLPGGLDRRIEPVLVAGAHLDMVGLGSLHNGVGIRHGHGHGLFDDDVDAVGDAVEGDLRVDSALRGNGRQSGLLRLDHLPIVGIAADGSVLLQAVLGQEGLHGLRLDVAHSGQFQVVVQHGFDVVDGDPAAADEHVFHVDGPLLFLENFLVQGQKLFFLHAPVEFFPHGLTAILSHLPGLLRMIQQIPDSGGDLLHVLRVHTDAA